MFKVFYNSSETYYDECNGEGEDFYETEEEARQVAAEYLTRLIEDAKRTLLHVKMLDEERWMVQDCILWLSQDEIEILSSSTDKFICGEIQPMINRPLNGQLWAKVEHFIQDVSKEFTDTPLSQSLRNRGGLVIKRKFLSKFRQCPGIFTDHNLNRLDFI